MEQTPAACAMDWSIQLEKNLRCKTPGKSKEALKEIGSRLELWNNDLKLKIAEQKMFDLIPGEDKLFLNAIFLRLADAFKLGNKQVKNGVVKLFYRMKRRMGRKICILSKDVLENYLELLRRVKEVFDGGDVEERGLALVLCGCWADFAKDCADIRYIVLSSLVSGDVLEVNGALFAAGSFCEISDDFADVFLEILITMVMSPDTERVIKLAGGRAFGKMWCSSSVADKAYKTGLKLVIESSEDDFSNVMLISLSRIASKCTLLIPNQMELLMMFLSEERSLHIQATSLRCLSFIVVREVCILPAATDTINKFFDILQRSEYSPTMQLEALNVLQKILLFNLSSIPCTEISELFLKLLVVIENLVKSSIVSTRVLAVKILADLSGKLLGSSYMVSCGSGSSLGCQVITFVLDQMLLLVIEVNAELEIKTLLNLLFNLAGKRSYICCLLLNNIWLFIDKLMKMLDKVPDTEQNGLSDLDISVKSLVESKLMLYLSKIVASSLQNLEKIDENTCEVLDALKLQLENVSRCSYFGSYTCMIYFLLLQLHAKCICLQHMNEDFPSLSRYLSLSCVDSFLQCDIFSVDCANKMLGENNNWSSYKAGKVAACSGAWSTAALIFEQLGTVVQSVSCSCWLKSLAHFSTSEKQLQWFLLREQNTSIVPCETNLGEKGGFALNVLRGCSTLISAEKLLATPDMGDIFIFQRWFLTIRAKFLKTNVEIMKLLDKVPFKQDKPGRQLERTSCEALTSFVHSSTQIACQMKKLAQELDLLSTSFMGIDRQSRMFISELALICSLMAFTAGFAFLIPNMQCSFKFVGSMDPFHALLLEDLAGRLKIDVEIRKNFMFLSKSLRNSKICSYPWLRTRIPNTSYDAMILHDLCKYSVRGIITLQNKASQVNRDDDAISLIVNDGSQLLLNISSRLMLIPLRAPNHFFRVRANVSSELFVMNEDGKHEDEISVLSGSHLSLNLCLQLKNMPGGLPGRLKKIYCILSCKVDAQVPSEFNEGKRESRFSMKDHEIDDMVELNKKLLRYVTSGERRGNDRLTADDYVCFELNRRRQGFSTCLLDVSAFPAGSYRLKWHSGCIDVEGSYWSPLPLNSGLVFTVIAV